MVPVCDLGDDMLMMGNDTKDEGVDLLREQQELFYLPSKEDKLRKRNQTGALAMETLRRFQRQSLLSTGPLAGIESPRLERCDGREREYVIRTFYQYRGKKRRVTMKAMIVVGAHEEIGDDGDGWTEHAELSNESGFTAAAARFVRWLCPTSTNESRLMAAAARFGKKLSRIYMTEFGSTWLSSDLLSQKYLRLTGFFFTICGLMLCSLPRGAHGKNKPKTVTYDAEVFVGVDDEDGITTCKTVLHYFVPFDKGNLPDEGIFFVAGKLAMVDKNTPVGDNFNWSDYVLQIEATVFEPIHFEDIMTPFRPFVSLSGTAGKHVDQRRFIVDMLQYVMNETIPVHHICECSASNPRFKDNVRCPFSNSFTTVLGHIASVDLVQTGSDSTKRILIDVSDIVFMSSDNLSQGSQNKTPTKVFWSSPSKSTSSFDSPNKRRAEDDISPSSSKQFKSRLSWEDKGKGKANKESDDESLTDIDDDNSNNIVQKAPTPPVERSTRRPSKMKQS
ncbi:hypothetical protein BGW80DRAFT_1254911 [Lactifluus volemus]|nr:hypothetical protein BGW80DRAFT_1254911 [Lactifluus volemus]